MTLHRVANSTQLQTALAKAVGGDSILLAPGNYGKVSIYNRNYASNVTIQTASTADRAHLDGLFVSNSKNLTFSGLDLGRGVAPGEVAVSTQLNWVRDSSNIRFTGVEIHGSEDNNPANDGMGMVATRVTGFRMDNSTFSELYRGLFVQQSSNAQILSNSFETIRSDGFMGAALNGATIADNSFTDFRPILGDHADAIQFWNTSQTVGSSNVTIRGNVIAPGQFGTVEVGNVQGIWIADPLTYGYKNFNISNNLIYTHGVWNGMGLYGGTTFTVANNTLLSQSGDREYVWMRAENMSGLTLKNNVAEDIILKNVTGLIQSNNIDLSNTPSFRSLIPDVDTPATLRDLIVTGAGFQAPTVTNTAAAATLSADAAPFYELQTAASRLMMMDAFVALP